MRCAVLAFQSTPHLYLITARIWGKVVFAYVVAGLGIHLWPDFIMQFTVERIFRRVSYLSFWPTFVWAAGRLATGARLETGQLVLDLLSVALQRS